MSIANRQMALHKAILHGKERRKPYYRSGKSDPTCRAGGTCPYCLRNRTHKHKRRAESTNAKSEPEVALIYPDPNPDFQSA